MVYRGNEQLTYSRCSQPGDREQYTAHTIKRNALQEVETLFIVALEVKYLCHLCKIWLFHGDDYEKYRLLECSTVWLWFDPTFRRNVCSHLLTCDLVLLTCPEDGGDTFLRNVSSNQSLTMLHPKRRYSSFMSFTCSTSKRSIAVRESYTHKRPKIPTKLNTASSAGKVYHYQ
jgi:hypothetical protein